MDLEKIHPTNIELYLKARSKLDKVNVKILEEIFYSNGNKLNTLKTLLALEDILNEKFNYNDDTRFELLNVIDVELDDKILKCDNLIESFIANKVCFANPKITNENIIVNLEKMKNYKKLLIEIYRIKQLVNSDEILDFLMSNGGLTFGINTYFVWLANKHIFSHELHTILIDKEVNLSKNAGDKSHVPIFYNQNNGKCILNLENYNKTWDENYCILKIRNY